MIRTVSLVLVCLAGVVGCASSGPEYENEAVAHALTTEAELRAWVSACETVSGASADAARTAERVWWERNGAMLRAADYGFMEELDGFADARREDSVALFTMKVGSTLSRQQEQAVADALDVRNPERVCQRELAAFEVGDRDLNQDADLYRALVALANQGEIDDQPLRSSRQPERPSDQFGRSYYEVETALTRSGCQEADIQMLSSSWPREVYQAQCSDQRYQLVSCEWNSCEVH